MLLRARVAEVSSPVLAFVGVRVTVRVTIARNYQIKRCLLMLCASPFNESVFFRKFRTDSENHRAYLGSDCSSFTTSFGFFRPKALCLFALGLLKLHHQFWYLPSSYSWKRFLSKVQARFRKSQSLFALGLLKLHHQFRHLSPTSLWFTDSLIRFSRLAAIVGFPIS